MLGMLLPVRASLWHQQDCVSFPSFQLQWGKTVPNGPNHCKSCAGGGGGDSFSLIFKEWGWSRMLAQIRTLASPRAASLQHLLGMPKAWQRTHSILILTPPLPELPLHLVRGRLLAAGLCTRALARSSMESACGTRGKNTAVKHSSPEPRAWAIHPPHSIPRQPPLRPVGYHGMLQGRMLPSQTQPRVGLPQDGPPWTESCVPNATTPGTGTAKVTLL